MTRYYLQRLASMLATFWCIATLTFIFMKLIPGDPFNDERALPPEILSAMMDHYGLNEPIHVQYFQYIKQLSRLDLGPSFKYPGRNVQEIIAHSFPPSAILGCTAMAIALGLGTLMGTLSALYRGKWQDRLTMLIAVIGISVPSFIAATLLQYLFAIKLGWLPVARWGGLSHTILPSIALAALPTAFIARLTRTSMLDIMSKDYIQTAQAKGASPARVLLRHAFGGAILPTVSYLGPLSAKILTGTFIIERIFGIPGMGQWIVAGISNRDYSIIMGMTLFYSGLLLCMTFIVDLIYPWLDPRIRLESS